MGDRPPVRFVPPPLTALEERLGDFVVRTLLPRSRKLATQIAARDVIGDEACGVPVSRELFPRNPAGQARLADPRELVLPLLANVGLDLSLQPDEMTKELVVTAP